MNRQVAVVGMGGIFPACQSVEEFSGKIFTNQSLVRRWDEAVVLGKQVRSNVSGFITLEEAGLSAQWSTIAPGYPDTLLDLRERIPYENLATSDIGSVWAMLSSLDAVKTGGWNKQEVESERTGIAIGSGGGGHSILRPSWNSFFNDGKKSRALGPHGVGRAMTYRDAANVSCLLKTKGLSESLGSACATGLGNIGYAYRMIKYGIQDRMIAGGVEGTSIETFIGFDAMSILSRGFEPELSSRPFDKNRSGFVCSFGAAVVALEELELAKARGAEILAVINGFHANSDGDGNMFAPSYEGQKRLWKGLKADVPGLKPDVVKAHATSTPVGDAIELFSIVSELGEEGYHISAPKSQFGHMLGAAGSVEFIVALQMLKNQKVAPCLNSEELSDTREAMQDLDTWIGPNNPMAAYRHLIPAHSLEKEINQITCLNYGFGGTNAAMSISKYEGK
ncbi:MAG: beta-ketoacyl synthase [Bacteroidetes bacterium]|nr:beta-ketoacyl synthase [Bacteroidota bacterium]